MIRFVNTPGADALTPPSGRTVVFVDDTGVPAYKDSSGVVHSLQGTDGTGVPAGGTTGQVLRKADNTDYNTEWHTLGTAAEEDVSSFVLASQLGVSVAQLVGGTVPAGQLPSYVDDVLEFTNQAAFPATGETGKIYIALDTNRQYRWTGSVYVQLVASPGTTDNVPEGTTNLYFTTGRAAAAAPVQSVSGRTGTIVLTAADVSGAVNTTTNQTVGGTKTFSAAIAFSSAGVVTATKTNLGLPITVSATAPGSPSEGDVWIDIS